jgi:hypothetical protein
VYVTSAVEAPGMKANEASLCIAPDVDGLAAKRERLRRRRDEDEPRAVRDGEVGRPREARLDAAGEAPGYARQERHSGLARERLAGRTARELHAMG